MKWARIVTVRVFQTGRAWWKTRRRSFVLGVEQRLEFIAFRLFWDGQVNRSDLMEQFWVSAIQASTDLNRYIGFAPNNLVYNKGARTYVRGPERSRQFLRPDASRYLACPDLSERQKKVVALDYGTRGGKAETSVRRSLLHYTLKRLGLDTDSATRPPQEQQIVLVCPIEGLEPGSFIEPGSSIESEG